MISIERLVLIICFVIFGLNFAKADELLSKTSAGRAPARNLKIKKSKVPTFEIHGAQGAIPRLDIGEEAAYSFNSSSRAPASAAEASAPVTLKPIQKAATPASTDFDARKANVSPATPAKEVHAGKSAADLPELKPLAKIDDPVTKEPLMEARKLREFSPTEGKLLEAQIILEKHSSPETALGLLVELLDDKMVQTEARYTYALAARKLGLDSEFRSILMKIAQTTKDKEWGKTATEALVREVEALDISDMKALSELAQRYEVETDNNPAYAFYRAKYFLEAGDLGQVEDAVKGIPEKSKYYADALLIAALSAYRQGDADRAMTSLKSLLDSSSADTSIRSTGAITLARIYFQKGDYKKAYDTYLKVDKSSSLWMQAMIEQAWSQILTQDYEGAAGNMFSLHTDYFKNSFAPESYTARSVAYLNLCQFGDGLQALENFKRKYGPLVGRLDKYRTEKKSPQDDYETVRTWLKNTDLKEVAGLPRSFIVELARHPSFMKTQMQINAFEDESERFTKATVTLIQLEKDLIRRQNEMKEEMQKVRALRDSGKSSMAETQARLDGLDRDLASAKIRYELAKRARGFVKDARARAIARIDGEKVTLKEKASKALRVRLETLMADLTHVLEQNEVLQYEILAGAGEHLRAQSAGADIEKKEQPKTPDGKSVKWSFKGEIWEDEIGHYRSSLKNVCPKDDKIASY